MCLLRFFQERLSVDFLSGRNRQCAVIFQKYYAAAVCLGSGGAVGWVGNHTLGLLGVTVGVVKHAQRKQFGQRAGHSAIQRFVGQYKLLFGKALRHGVGVIVVAAGTVIRLLPGLVVEQAADDIHTRMVHGKADTFGDIQHFDAPSHIVSNAGVRVDVAGKAHLPAQHRVDKVVVVGKAIGLHVNHISLQIALRCAFFGRRFGVVRHDRGCACLDGGSKRRQMVGFQTAGGGVNVPLPRCIVGVKAVFTRTAAREMLGGYCHAVGGHALVAALDAGNNVGHNLADQRRILTKSTVGTLPARISHGVCHVHIALAQAAGVPLSAHSGGKFVNQINAIALDSGGNSQGARPGGHYTAGVVHAKDQFTVFVAGVGRRSHGDKMLALLTDSVGLIHPVRHIGGGGVCTQNHMAVEPIF